MDNKNADISKGNLPAQDGSKSSGNVNGGAPKVNAQQNNAATGDFARVRRSNQSRAEDDAKVLNAERSRMGDVSAVQRGDALQNGMRTAPVPQSHRSIHHHSQSETEVRKALLSDTRPIDLTGASQVQSPAETSDGTAHTLQVPVVSQNGKTTTADVTSSSSKNDETRSIDPAVKSGAIKKVRPAKSKKIKKRSDNERSESGNTVLSLVKCMAYITVVFAVSIVISVAVIFIANDKYGFVKSEEEIEVVIPKGTEIEDVAEILYNYKIIKYKWLFNSDFAGSGIKIEPGTYTLVPETSYDELVDAIRKKPPVGISWITIPEGYTTDEIIDLFVASGIGERDEYVDVINNYEFDYWFVKEIDEDWEASGRTYRLDGYLFPDTYQFYNASSEAAVIGKLLSRFNQVFISSYKQRTEEIGFSTDDVLTLSSLIEKEAGTANYFGNVSSVFHNRLALPSSYPYLESDATTAYVIQHETGVRVKIKGSDVDNIASEYNTYDTAGLTPGAIANSGNSAILASMHPTDTKYYFFYSPPNPKPGEDAVLFSRTIEEHNAIVSKYVG